MQLSERIKVHTSISTQRTHIARPNAEAAFNELQLQPKVMLFTVFRHGHKLNSSILPAKLHLYEITALFCIHCYEYKTKNKTQICMKD